MADAKHTPGPWRVEAGYRVEAPVFGMVAAVRGADGDPETIANARLIAAAPDGYKLAQLIKRLACTEELSTHVEVGFEPHDAALLLNAAEAFLARVEGR